MRRLTAPAAGDAIGALTGIADAVMLVTNFFGARPPGGYSLTMLAAVVWRGRPCAAQPESCSRGRDSAGSAVQR